MSAHIYIYWRTGLNAENNQPRISVAFRVVMLLVLFLHLVVGILIRIARKKGILE